MTTTHEAGPFVVFGQTTQGPTPDYNPDGGGPSLLFASAGLLDQRGYWSYQPGNLNFQGWNGAGDIFTINFVPAALATGNLANLATPTTAVALQLVTAAATAGVTIGASIRNAATQAVVSNLLVLDALTAAATGSITANVFTAASGATGTFTVGSVLSSTGGNTNVVLNTTIIGLLTGEGGTGTYLVTPSQAVTAQVTISGATNINGVPLVPAAPGNITGVQTGGALQGVSGPLLYNPLCMVGRNIRITTQSGDTAVYTVRGFDVYGFPMTEAITANGATTVSGKKAFKYVQSVTPVGTVGAGASVGTGDVYGFPLFSLTFQDVNMSWGTNTNTGLITSNVGYTAGDTTNPQTSTNGDPRGTYAVQSASNGTQRFTVWQAPAPTNIITTVGTYGVTPA
jgi:hypothetical protein